LCALPVILTIFAFALNAGVAAAEEPVLEPSGEVSASSASTELPAELPHDFLVSDTQNYREKFLAKSIGHFRQIAGADLILTVKEAATHKLYQAAKIRAKRIAYFLKFDLNGDFKVTRDELANSIFLDSGFSIIAKRQVPSLMTTDSDLNGQISMEEMSNSAMFSKRSWGIPKINADNYLAIDPNKDGNLSIDELEKYLIKNFARWDTNGNHTIDLAERTLLTNQVAKAQRQNYKLVRQTIITKQCVLPKPKTMKIIYIGAAYAGRISTATVAGQDKKTETTNIYVEPGTEPIYVVAASLVPMIWNVTGATKRIERFVITSSVPTVDYAGGGVVGLKKEQVHIPLSGACPQVATGISPLKIKNVTEQYLKILGVKFSAKFMHKTMPFLALPSGKSTSSPYDTVSGETTTDSRFNLNQMDGSLDKTVPQNISPAQKHYYYSHLNKFHRDQPYGVGEIDPTTVIANGSVEHYKVLPGLAGILQLIREGRIEVRNWRVYYVKKEIPQFPAGLNGGNSVAFVFAKGIAAPKGNAGHSCVFMEETGKPHPDMDPHNCSRFNLTK